MNGYSIHRSSDGARLGALWPTRQEALHEAFEMGCCTLFKGHRYLPDRFEVWHWRDGRRVTQTLAVAKN